MAKRKRLKTMKAKAEKHSRYNIPCRIYDIPEEESIEGEPREVAEAALTKVAPDLDINPDLSQLKFDKVKETILGTTVLFQQYHHDRPISDGWVVVYANSDGVIYEIKNDLVPQSVLEKPGAKAAKAPVLTSEGAADVAKMETGTADKETGIADIVETELVYWKHARIPVQAWKVVIEATRPAEEWKVYVDASNGEILDKQNLIKRAQGKGRVFDPGPVVTLNNTSLSDRSEVPDAAYSEVSLPDLEGSGNLDGPYVSTANTKPRVKKDDRVFMFKRGDRAFNEVMVYYHIDRVQRYMQQLGYVGKKGILNHQIQVNAAGGPDDNSFYSPVSESLTFGFGGVDDAEDAEIILHEYGHAIQDNQVPGWGSGPGSQETDAMGEGFGDYLAGSFFADLKSEVLKPTVGSWDAVSYSAAEPPCLRRLDSNKLYPKDIVGEEHDDGEIWSACLWQLRNAVGRTTADTLILAHHFLLTRSAKFEDAANALITADEQLNEGRNKDVIRKIFTQRGILPNPKKKGRRAGDNIHKAGV